MKKRINLFLSIVLIVLLAFVLVGCNKDDNSGGGDGGSTTKKTVIKYCNWNFGTEEENNLTRRRVEAFNKASKTVRIELVVPIDGAGYDEFLTTLAAAGELPDIFMVNSVPTAVINQWALDITPYTQTDAEWNNIPESLRDSITYNGHIYAVPAGQYYMGLFANYDLIDNYLKGGVDAEEKFATGAFTTDEWVQVVKDMRDINHTDGTGVIGMNSAGDMINWLPSSLDKTGNTKHFVWNGRRFEFTSDLMIQALTIISQLGDTTQQYVFDSIPELIGEGEEAEEYRSKIFGSSSAEAVFTNGQMGFIQQGSWAAAYENVDFNYSFISYPDAKVVVASDYMCISKASKNPDIAYEVAKFLNFGEEGLNTLFDIIESNPDDNLSLTGVPLNTTKALSDKWFSFIHMKGYKETFEKVQSGEIEAIVEGNKSIPGFLKARYTTQTGLSFEYDRGGALLTIGDFIWDVCGGQISVNEYITNMTDALCNMINDEVRKDFEAMGLEY